MSREACSAASLRLFVVINAAARQFVAREDETLQDALELAVSENADRWRHRGFRVLDRDGHEQPLDVEIGLLGYEQGQALYVYPPRA